MKTDMHSTEQHPSLARSTLSRPSSSRGTNESQYFPLSITVVTPRPGSARVGPLIPTTCGHAMMRRRVVSQLLHMLQQHLAHCPSICYEKGCEDPILVPSSSLWSSWRSVQLPEGCDPTDHYGLTAKPVRGGCRQQNILCSISRCSHIHCNKGQIAISLLVSYGYIVNSL